MSQKANTSLASNPKHRALWAIVLTALVGLLPFAAVAAPNLANPMQGSTFSGKKLPSPAVLSNGTLKVRLQNDRWFLEGRLTGNSWYPSNPRIRQADALTQQMKLGVAEQQYQTALKANPNDAGAHHGLGQTTFLRTTSSNGAIRQAVDNYHEEAVQHLLTALRLQPNYVDANVTLAKVYLDELNRKEDAREYAANAYQLAPNRSDVLTLVGRMLLEDGQAEEALPLLSKATRVDARNASAHTYLGKAHHALGNTQKALDALNTALWLQPHQAPVHDVLANIYKQQGNQAAAVSHWQQALEIKPEYTEASVGLAELYAQRQDWPLALGVLKNGYHSVLPSWYTQKTDMAMTIGRMALENRQPQVAQTYFQEVLNSNPNHWEARQGLSQAQLQQAQLALVDAQAYGGDILTREQSLATLQQALKTDRTNVQAKLVQTKVRGSARHLDDISAEESQLVMDDLSYSVTDSLAQGELWTARFDPMRAERSFAAAVQSPIKPEDQIKVGDMLLTLGQPEFAKQAFQRAAKSPDPMIQSGAKQGLKLAAQQEQRALQALRYAQQDQSNDVKPPEQWLEEALQANQRLPEAHYLLAQLCEHQQEAAPEKVSKAIRHYHAFMALAPTSPQASQAEQRIARLVSQVLKAEAKVSTNQSRS
ncbi:MAG: tetratricopeptide repeat protein [Vampirovibrionales bacterium]|nr:tetratricopeptide repeat protein [Vampirovibrionales bacterium]